MNIFFSTDRLTILPIFPIFPWTTVFAWYSVPAVLSRGAVSSIPAGHPIQAGLSGNSVSTVQTGIAGETTLSYK